MSFRQNPRNLSHMRGKRPSLPGTPDPHASDVEAMIRVDHAGEFGALRIYEGQLAVLSRNPTATAGTEAIRRMAEQERTHFDALDKLVKDRAVRPTALEPVWHVAGFALGAATALLGEKVAMACTVAVEDVIDEHYSKQIERLGDSDPELRNALVKFHQDECEHRAEALEHGAGDAPGYELLTSAIRLSCRIAISLSERL
jgi:ubiquinone biosynthesis monooxygenase Coq7